MAKFKDFSASKMLDDMRERNRKALEKKRMSEMSDERANAAYNAEATALSLGETTARHDPASQQNFTPEQRVKATDAMQEEIKGEVDKNKDLTGKDKKIIKKKVSSPEKVARIVQKEQEGEKMSVSDQFVNALTYFGPNMLGMAIGGLFEGTEGAIAGGEAASGLAKQYRDDKMKEEAHKAKLEDTLVDNATNARRVDMEEKRMNAKSGGKGMFKWQQAKGLYEKDADGKLHPLSYEANSGEYVNTLTGKKVDPKNIYSDAQRRMIQSGQLSGKQQEAVSGFDSTLRGLASIDELKGDVNTGYFAGKGQKIGEKFGFADESFTSLKAETENIKASFLKAMSGAQVSDREAARLAQIIPNIEDDDNVFSAKSGTFRKIVERNKDALLASIRTGQPLKKEIVEDMLAIAEASNLLKPLSADNPYGLDQGKIAEALQRKQRNKGGK